MRQYIATLYDVTDELPTGVFQLPSSSLVPCEQDVAFSFVIADHRYAARIQGYDRTDLEKPSPGSPNAVDRDGRVVPPRWTTECGRQVFDDDGAGGSPGEGGAGGAEGDTPAPGFSVAGVTSTNNFTVYASYCLPLVDHGPETPTGITVGLAQAQRDLDCGTDTGEIARFSAELVGASSAPVTKACDELAEFTGLDSGSDYAITVLAFEADARSPRWFTTCRGIARQGALTPASCDPLRER